MYQGCIPIQATPASSWCPQPLVEVECEQDNSRCSVPLQPTLSKWIGPVPWPKCASEYALAPIKKEQAYGCITVFLTWCYTIGSCTIILLYSCYYCYNFPTYGRVSQLSTDHLCIWYTPIVITHCSPSMVETYLYSTLNKTRSSN